MAAADFFRVREEIGNYAKRGKETGGRRKGGEKERGVRGGKCKRRVMMSMFAL